MEDEKLRHITQMLLDIHQYLNTCGTERPYTQSIDYNNVYYLTQSMWSNSSNDKISYLETEINMLRQELEELKSQNLINNIN